MVVVGLNKITISVFVDGFGWKLLQRYPFLENECPRRCPVETLPGYSSTCDPTYLTGAAPRDHGHFSFYYWDPDNSPFKVMKPLALLPGIVFDRGRVRHWISRAVGTVYGYTGYFELYSVPFRYLPYFNYSEKKDIYQPGGIIGGQPTVFDHLRRDNIPFVLADWRRPEAENFAGVHEAVASGRPRLAWMFCGGLDGILHGQGTSGSGIRPRLDWYQSEIMKIVETARARYDEVALHVFSDHGMADVVGSIDVISALEKAGLRFAVDYGAMFDSTMARFWFLSPGAESGIRRVLDKVGHGRVLSDAELARHGCDFPDRRYGEMFFQCDPGYLIVPSFMGLKPIPGMHGYDPFHEDSVAMYMTNSGGSLPAGLADIFGVICDDAGLTR